MAGNRASVRSARALTDNILPSISRRPSSDAKISESLGQGFVSRRDTSDTPLPPLSTTAPIQLTRPPLLTWKNFFSLLLLVAGIYIDWWWPDLSKILFGRIYLLSPWVPLVAKGLGVTSLSVAIVGQVKAICGEWISHVVNNPYGHAIVEMVAKTLIASAPLYTFLFGGACEKYFDLSSFGPSIELAKRVMLGCGAFLAGSLAGIFAYYQQEKKLKKEQEDAARSEVLDRREKVVEEREENTKALKKTAAIIHADAVNLRQTITEERAKLLVEQAEHKSAVKLLARDQQEIAEERQIIEQEKITLQQEKAVFEKEKQKFTQDRAKLDEQIRQSERQQHTVVLEEERIRQAKRMTRDKIASTRQVLESYERELAEDDKQLPPPFEVSIPSVVSRQRPTSPIIIPVYDTNSTVKFSGSMYTIHGADRRDSSPPPTSAVSPFSLPYSP